MKVISCRNVNEAYPRGMRLIQTNGVRRPSRAGAVYEVPEPVTTVYTDPEERVLFNAARDANPFFHFMESLWMLAGRNDLELPVYYAKNMSRFSENMTTLNGAYGYRWRRYFTKPIYNDLATETEIKFIIEHRPLDQLVEVIRLLKADPTTRRAVLQMWAVDDLYNQQSLDLPCNTNVYFKIRQGNGKDWLDMTVCNRSNDIIWGAYGANVVHMSVLQEYVASMVGVKVGTYNQMSDSFHAYEDVFDPLIERINGGEDYYISKGLKPYPLVQNPVTFDQDLELFMGDPTANNIYWNMFFNEVARPLAQAWRLYKTLKGVERRAAIGTAYCIAAEDWKWACVEWLERRIPRADS